MFIYEFKRRLATSRAPKILVLSIIGPKNGPNTGMAATRSLVGGWRQRPSQKFGCWATAISKTRFTKITN